MSIYSNAVKRPITTIMIFIALVVMGGYSLVQLPIDLYPEMDAPFISVLTYYPGANASDVETNVTRPIEDGLNTVSNLKEISSTSLDNTSVLFLEFEWETDLDEAANDIRDAIGFVESYLPDDSEKPTILKFNTSMMPIIMYAVTAGDSYVGLEKILDEKVVNPLNRIEGIGSVGLAGTPGREIQVEVDPRKMEAYNLTIEQIGNILAAENMNMPAGNVEMGSLDYPLRIQGEFEESSEIASLVVGNYRGNPIYMRDVAEVTDSIRDMTIDTKINGQTGIQMYIQKQSGGNTVKVAREVKQELKKLEKELPSDVEITEIWDSSEFITDSISNLTKTLMYAGLFVILVILFFLGRWRATFIVILTIPIALIVSFIYLYATGNSINIISLSSLSIAIGMVVDDAIVVLENITKHIERKSRPREAAVYATNEVWLAVIVTTLTVVAVFLPLTMVGGLTGVLFNQLGWIVSLTVITSTLTAITLTPVLSSLMLRLKSNGKERKLSYDNTIKKFLNALDGFYARTIGWALHHKLFTFLAALLIFVASLFLISRVGTEFIPESDQGYFSASVELQTGMRLDETTKTARRIDSILKTQIPEVAVVSTSAGVDNNGDFSVMFADAGSHIINYEISLVDQAVRNRNTFEVAEDLRSRLSQFPGIVHFNVTTDGGFSMMGGNTVEVEVYGYDFDETNRVARELAEALEGVEGARDINISRNRSKPELQIILDKDKLSEHGLNTAIVSNAVRNRVEGLTASRFREFGDEYDIVVRFKEEYRNSITDLEHIALQTPMGTMVRLGEIGDIVEYWSPPNIERKDRERLVIVSATPYKRALGDIAADVETIIAGLDIPSGVSIQLSGAIEDQMEAFMDLGLLMILSLLLVYIVMASQFESLRMPFIIMFSIPFAFSGVFIALYLTGTKLSVIAAIGAVMLIGIVVKNAIVLVDYINLMRDRGMKLYEAIEVSGRSRLRPVLMTSMTTILGMLPLAMSTGEGSEIWSPMGISVIGGLIFSTMVTLVLVPVVYALFARRGERRKRKSLEYSFLD